jgi:transposase
LSSWKEIAVGFREVGVVEVREVLRAWLGGAGLRKAAGAAGVDRKTARRYVAAAEAAGLARPGSAADVTDELVGRVVEAVRPGRPAGRGESWAALEARRERVERWAAGLDPDTGERAGRPLTAVKVAELLAREGCPVPYRTVHRYMSERCSYRDKGSTVRVADGDPGVELQVDFGYMGMIADAGSGRRRKVHALVFTAVFSRHMFVWLTFSQTLAAVVAGCEAAWDFFGGVFKVLVPDNLSPVVKAADSCEPVFTAGWLDYSQHAGFSTDPARVKSPKDKPRVERVIQYVRSSMWDGERFASLDAAQSWAVRWCRERAGGREHGTTRAKPAEVFEELEAPLLAPRPGPCDRPVFADVKVHRDLHVQVCRALYSVPAHLAGRTLRARADSELVKLWDRGRLVKTHPRVEAGRRSTDEADVPPDKAAYALRDAERLAARAEARGNATGEFARRLLDVPLPWTRMRSVHRLLGLAERYGPQPVEDACAASLGFDVVQIGKIASMVRQAAERAPVDLPRDQALGGRFARPAGQFAGHVQLSLIHGGLDSRVNEEMLP